MGSFDTDVAAAECYDRAVLAKGGSKRLLNFPKRAAPAAEAELPGGAAAAAFSSSPPAFHRPGDPFNQPLFVAAAASAVPAAATATSFAPLSPPRAGGTPSPTRVSPSVRSKYRGVKRNATSGVQWDTTVWVSGARAVVGTFDSELAAAECYDSAIRASGGSRNLLNFPHQEGGGASGVGEADGESESEGNEVNDEGNGKGNSEGSEEGAKAKAKAEKAEESEGGSMHQPTEWRRRRNQHNLLPTPRFVRADEIVALSSDRLVSKTCGKTCVPQLACPRCYVCVNPTAFPPGQSSSMLYSCTSSLSLRWSPSLPPPPLALQIRSTVRHNLVGYSPRAFYGVGRRHEARAHARPNRQRRCSLFL